MRQVAGLDGGGDAGSALVLRPHGSCLHRGEWLRVKETRYKIEAGYLPYLCAQVRSSCFFSKDRF
jgi:hypothetical protein